ncbi:MAG: shikimate dehydrogenase, partial [Micavibrio aeruginosavorus]
EYGRVEIAPEELRERIANMIADGYAGFNVTIPHKQAIFALCESVDEKATAIGAVNTVVVRNGKLYGSNTDAFGFIENFKSQAPGFDFAKGPIVVLGAGGAARAIVYGLIEEGAKKIIITNRTEEKAREIAMMAPSIISAAKWEDREEILKNAAALINTTALGMTGKDALEINLQNLPQYAVVSDIVYVPLMTQLLVDAKARGNTVVTGIGMLLHQARPAFEKWFGVMPEVDKTLEEKVLA